MTETDARTHACPRTGCPTRVERAHLACPDHWRLLSRQTRQAVYAADRSRNPQRVVEALTAAIEEMNR